MSLLLAQGRHKISLEHFNAPESKEVLPVVKLEPFEQPNKVVLDYNTQYKITIHEFILTKIKE